MYDPPRRFCRAASVFCLAGAGAPSNTNTGVVHLISRYATLAVIATTIDSHLRFFHAPACLRELVQPHMSNNADFHIPAIFLYFRPLGPSPEALEKTIRNHHPFKSFLRQGTDWWRCHETAIRFWKNVGRKCLEGLLITLGGRKRFGTNKIIGQWV